MHKENRLLFFSGEQPNHIGNGNTPDKSFADRFEQCDINDRDQLHADLEALQFDTVPNILLTMSDYYTGQFQIESQAERDHEPYAQYMLNLAQYYEMRYQQWVTIRAIDKRYREFSRDAISQGLLQVADLQESDLTQAANSLSIMMRQYVANMERFCNPDQQSQPDLDEHRAFVVEFRIASNEFESLLGGVYQNAVSRALQNWGADFGSIPLETMQRQSELIAKSTSELIQGNLSLLAAQIMAFQALEIGAEPPEGIDERPAAVRSAAQGELDQTQREQLTEQLDSATEQLRNISQEFKPSVLDAFRAALDDFVVNIEDQVAPSLMPIAAPLEPETRSFADVYDKHKEQLEDAQRYFSETLDTLDSDFRQWVLDSDAVALGKIHDFLQDSFQPALETLINAKTSFITDLIDAGMQRKVAYEFLESLQEKILLAIAAALGTVGILMTPARKAVKPTVNTLLRLGKLIFRSPIILAALAAIMPTATASNDQLYPTDNLAALEIREIIYRGLVNPKTPSDQTPN